VYNADITTDVFDTFCAYAGESAYIQACLPSLYASLSCYFRVRSDDVKSRYNSLYINSSYIMHVLSRFTSIDNVIHRLENSMHDVTLLRNKHHFIKEYTHRLIDICSFIFDRIAEDKTISYGDVTSHTDFYKYMFNMSVKYDRTGKLLTSFMACVHNRTNSNECVKVLTEKYVQNIYTSHMSYINCKGLMTVIAQKGNYNHIKAVDPYIADYDSVSHVYKQNNPFSWLHIALYYAHIPLIEYCLSHGSSLEQHEKNNILEHVFSHFLRGGLNWKKAGAVRVLERVLSHPYDRPVTSITSSLEDICCFIACNEKDEKSACRVMDNIQCLYRRYEREREAVRNNADVEGKERIYYINDHMYVNHIQSLDVSDVKKMLGTDYNLCDTFSSIISLMDRKISSAGGLENIISQNKYTKASSLSECMKVRLFRKDLARIIGMSDNPKMGNSSHSSSLAERKKSALEKVMDMYIKSKRPYSIYDLAIDFCSVGVMRYALMHEELNHYTYTYIFDDNTGSYVKSDKPSHAYERVQTMYNAFIAHKSFSHIMNTYDSKAHRMCDKSKQYEIADLGATTNTGMSHFRFDNSPSDHYIPMRDILKKRVSLMSLFSQRSYKNMLKEMLSDEGQKVIHTHNTSNVLPDEITRHVLSYINYDVPTSHTT
jgi:hypothetical protein